MKWPNEAFLADITIPLFENLDYTIVCKGKIYVYYTKLHKENDFGDVKPNGSKLKHKTT